MASASPKPWVPSFMPRRANLVTLTTTTTTVMMVVVMMMMMMMTPVASSQAGVTCPPKDEKQKDPALEEIFYYSDLVLMGKVTERHLPPGRKEPSAVYTAEMEVYCVYKGANVPAVINITDAGKPPHLCFETNFEVGMSYMAYLKKHKNGRLSPAYPQNPEGYKDEMIFICDVNITLPVGLKKLPENVKCEDQKDYDYPSYDDYDYGEEDGKGNASRCFSYKPKDDKEQTYETAKTQDGDDDSGNEPLRMSLLLLALLYIAVLVFS